MINSLLEPISNEKPAGDDLRYELIDAKREQLFWHDKIREARREDPFAIIPKKADWKTVREYSSRALGTKSKDIQFATWLIESMIVDETRDQFHGFIDGMELLRGLIERYWDDIHPVISADDPDAAITARVNILSIFDNSAASLIKVIPIIEGKSGGRYSYAQYEESKRFDIPDDLSSFNSDKMEQVEQLRKQIEEEARVTGEMWRKAAESSSYEFIKSRLDLIARCCVQAGLLDELMEEKLKLESPGLRGLRNSLDDIRLLVEKYEREKRPVVIAQDESENNDGSVDVSGEGRTLAQAGALRTRADALRRLSEVAEYFRRTEPHSPLSFLIQRAVRWGNMPLDQLFAELIKDGSVLDNVKETLGMNAE